MSGMTTLSRPAVPSPMESKPGMTWPQPPNLTPFACSYCLTSPGYAPFTNSSRCGPVSMIPLGHQAEQIRVLHQAFGVGVERGGHFVQQQDRGVAQDSAGGADEQARHEFDDGRIARAGRADRGMVLPPGTERVKWCMTGAPSPSATVTWPNSITPFVTTRSLAPDASPMRAVSYRRSYMLSMAAKPTYVSATGRRGFGWVWLGCRRNWRIATGTSGSRSRGVPVTTLMTKANARSHLRTLNEPWSATN